MSKLWHGPSRRKEYNAACGGAPHRGGASSVVVARSPSGGGGPRGQILPKLQEEGRGRLQKSHTGDHRMVHLHRDPGGGEEQSREGAGALRCEKGEREIGNGSGSTE
jgi:hypothetical protein